MNTNGRVTIPTDMDAVPETLDLLKRWGADAIRDCDGTEFPQELKDTGAKIYATYYTTRKDNAWAKANPDETQQCYIMTPFYTAEDDALTIPLMTGISRELMKVNDHDDIARWWEVIDRTTGEALDAADWHYDAAAESVVIDVPAAYHEYTVSFLAYLIWDPVHMYNSVINDWKDVEHQIPFDVRQPKTHAYTMRRLREYLESHPYVNVVRFTTFSTCSRWCLTSCAARSMWTGTAILPPFLPIFWNSLKRRSAISFAPSLSSIRATTTTSTVCPPRSTRISRHSSAARSPV